MRSYALMGLLLVGMAGSAGAVPIADFTGRDVSLSVTTTSSGGQGFFASLASPGVATIGAGPEFTLQLGANGFTTRTLRVDFEGSGLVRAYADQQFAIGNTSFADFSFEVAFTIAGAALTGAVGSGDLVRGSASVAGLDPVIWTFVNEQDNAFGRIMTLGPLGGVVPQIQLSAERVPGPAAAPLLGLAGLAALALRRRRLHRLA